ncbi:peptidylprolyl isomerase [Prolixibacteraceae bacterium JC049]|nr:peptidylprolyl isomerase [Prolixibacteraceae bacterium JC049]
MSKMPKQLVIVFFLFICFGWQVSAQDKVVDQVVAIVGNNPILKSDVENVYLQRQMQGDVSDGDMKCEILEDLLIEKLLVAEAELDTNITVTEAQINRTMDGQIQRYLQYAGSVEELERNMGKKLPQIKADMKEMISNQLLTQQMRQKIIGDLTVTPSEVRYFYRGMKEDEKPNVKPQLEYAQIVLIPRVSQEEDMRVKARLRDFKKRVETGKTSFATLAIMYSEGPSAKNGGEMDYMGRGQLDKSYADAAFNLKGDRISNVVRSEFGYHIIQVVDRKGQKLKTRHIIMKPKVDAEELEKATNALDSLATGIRKKEISFEQAAYLYSGDKDSKNSGGLVLNPNTMATRFDLSQLNPADSKVLKEMKIGEISEPFEAVDAKGRKVVKIVMLKNRIKAHRADLKNDYKLISDRFLNKKQEQTLDKWIGKQQSDTYIHIDESYANCNFRFSNWVK